MRNSTVQARLDHQLDALRDSVKHLVDIGGDKAGAIRDSAMSGVKHMGKVIKEHPIAAVAIAFGIGYIAMRIVRR
jgi:hypothetical protein